MKTLNKYAYDYLKVLISNNELNSIKYYCEGLGFDVNNYSSPVCFCNQTNKLCVTYRRNKFYFEFIGGKFYQS